MPAPTPVVELIIEMLRGEATRDAIQQAVAEQESTLTRFVSLLIKEEEKQAEERAEGGTSAVVDDSTCKR